jgi:hypothetical protein
MIAHLVCNNTHKIKADEILLSLLMKMVSIPININEEYFPQKKSNWGNNSGENESRMRFSVVSEG